jgi:small subunit ribosomal protein S9
MSKIVVVSGKRKRAVARATVKEGCGKVRINKIPLANMEPEMLRLRVTEPLRLASEYASKVNIDVTTFGGGATGQVDAARLAIARGLLAYSNNNVDLRKTFLDYDRQLLVADIRRREKRKPNTCGKARSKRQKSYR